MTKDEVINKFEEILNNAYSSLIYKKKITKYNYNIIIFNEKINNELYTHIHLKLMDTIKLPYFLNCYNNNNLLEIFKNSYVSENIYFNLLINKLAFKYYYHNNKLNIYLILNILYYYSNNNINIQNNNENNIINNENNIINNENNIINNENNIINNENNIINNENNIINNEKILKLFMISLVYHASLIQNYEIIPTILIKIINSFINYVLINEIYYKILINGIYHTIIDLYNYDIQNNYISILKKSYIFIKDYIIIKDYSNDKLITKKNIFNIINNLFTINTINEYNSLLINNKLSVDLLLDNLKNIIAEQFNFNNSIKTTLLNKNNDNESNSSDEIININNKLIILNHIENNNNIENNNSILNIENNNNIDNIESIENNIPTQLVIVKNNIEEKNDKINHLHIPNNNYIINNTPYIPPINIINNTSYIPPINIIRQNSYINKPNNIIRQNSYINNTFDINKPNNIIRQNSYINNTFDKNISPILHSNNRLLNNISPIRYIIYQPPTVNPIYNLYQYKN
jgi:hypothetical protein